LPVSGFPPAKQATVVLSESCLGVYEFCTDTFYIPEETIEFQTDAGRVEPK